MGAPIRLLAGGTRRFTWIVSGTTPTTIYAVVWTGSESIVNTYAATSSGNGHYFVDLPVPNAPGYYVAGWIVTNNSKPYRTRTPFKVVLTEVD